MMPNSTTFHDLTDETAGVADQVREAASQVKDKVSEKMDANRNTAARGLEGAANALHEKAENLPGGEKVTRMAHSAAHTLKSTAEYIREHDFRSVMGDCGEVVKRNPVPSLLVAGLIGFAVGRALAAASD